MLTTKKPEINSVQTGQTNDQKNFLKSSAEVKNPEEKRIKEAVKKTYGAVAVGKAGLFSSSSSCCSSKKSCCGGSESVNNADYAKQLGYKEKDLEGFDGANLGLGCGNPVAIASLSPGEIVLDLGSGAGFDCFLASKKVGPTGKVIGIDMTTEMIDKARANALKRGYTNVEFCLAEMEHLPFDDNSVDVIISNCVVNLSPSKLKVFKEAARVLKPNGRLALSDIIATQEFPESIKNNLALYTGCMSGAVTVSQLEENMRSCGFEKIEIQVKEDSRNYIKHWSPESSAEDYVASAYIFAYKPSGLALINSTTINDPT